LRRSHPILAIVCKCRPIRDLNIQGLEFTGQSAVGFHAHCAQDGYFRRITTAAWTGRIGFLLDTGGARNIAEDCYTKGTIPGVAPGESVWGVALEGQEESRAIRCGGEKNGNGLTFNFCTDSYSIGAVASQNNVNIGFYTSSIRCRMAGSVLCSPYAANSHIPADCLDCQVVA